MEDRRAEMHLAELERLVAEEQFDANDREALRERLEDLVRMLEPPPAGGLAELFQRWWAGWP
ncbi:MAG: hypothetical protein EOO71_10150 [Myxococcaceae bacterium]|nr:MAG: hypothetical protein EOO71_10150 [Myxococcaceae bacterium]